MKVIFLKNQPGGGRKGELKDVSEGYGKNFLIAKGFAAIATPEIQAKVAKEQKEAVVKQQKEAQQLQALRNELEKKPLTLTVKVGGKGQIFSGVHDKDIAEAVGKRINVSIDRHQIDLKKPIKELGLHSVTVKLAAGVQAQLKLNIESV